VTVSYLELYNEELHDLLAVDDDPSKPPLKMCFSESRRGVTIPGLEEIRVTSPEDIFHILERSAHKRQTAATLLNKHSSYVATWHTIQHEMQRVTSLMTD
jgi:hypothetical protein